MNITYFLVFLNSTHNRKGHPSDLLSESVLIIHSIILVQLRSRRNLIIHHQQVQPLMSVILINRADQHTAGIDSHHLPRRQVRDRDAGLSNQLLRLVILMNPA